MEKSIANYIMDISSYAVVVPLVVAGLNFKNNNFEQRRLSVLIFVSFFIEILAKILADFKISNLPVLHVFTIIEFSLIALIFKNSFKNFLPQKSIYYLIGIFSIASILNSVFHETIFQFNAYARAVEALLIILLALMYFYSTLKNMTEKDLGSSPIFWISSGVLLYFSSSLFIFIYSNILFGVSENSFTIWGLHALMSIVLYIFYTIALWVKPKQ